MLFVSRVSGSHRHVSNISEYKVTRYGIQKGNTPHERKSPPPCSLAQPLQAVFSSDQTRSWKRIISHTDAVNFLKNINPSKGMPVLAIPSTMHPSCWLHSRCVCKGCTSTKSDLWASFHSMTDAESYLLGSLASRVSIDLRHAEGDVIVVAEGR